MSVRRVISLCIAGRIKLHLVIVLLKIFHAVRCRIYSFFLNSNNMQSHKTPCTYIYEPRTNIKCYGYYCMTLWLYSRCFIGCSKGRRRKTAGHATLLSWLARWHNNAQSQERVSTNIIAIIYGGVAGHEKSLWCTRLSSQGKFTCLC